MLKKRFIYILFPILLANTIFATDYYVDINSMGGSCSNSNPGTISQPLCSISEANSRVNPGDTVYLRGGTYTQTIKPTNSGTPENYITYARYGDEEVIITDVYHGVDLVNRHHVIIDGLKILDVNAYWVNLRHDSIKNHAHHNIIKNCYMEEAGGWGGIYLKNTNYNKIVDNVFKGYYGPDDLITTYYSSYNLIENNEFNYGSHVSLSFLGGERDDPDTETSRNVIRNNIIRNPWHTCFSIVMNADRNLAENNILLDCGEDFENDPTPGSGNREDNNGFQLSSSNTIFRNNFIINAGRGISFNTYLYEGIMKYALDNRIYHNTFNRNYYGFDSNTQNPTYDNIFKNNLLYNNRLYEVRVYITGNPNDNFYFSNNILGASLNWQNQYYTLDQLQTSYSDYWQNNIASDPKFINEDNRDLSLQPDSLMIDAATSLTKVANIDTETGATLRVNDATYFQDGFNGIVEADWIAVGNVDNIVQIESIDSYNTITLKNSISRNIGDEVWLYKDSCGKRVLYGNAPDIGAFEYEGITLIGDVDLDNDVDLTDLISVAIIFGKEEGELEFNPNADFNNNNVIDLPDLITVAIHFGKQI